VVAIRSNHSVLLPLGQRVRANRWCQFTRTFSDQSCETRYIREIIYGKRTKTTYWELTTDPETMPSHSTSFVMTNLQGNLKKKLGDLYGLRTWVEYGFRQCKQELGWTHYRFTNFSEIEKWWEIICSVYLMISLQTPVFQQLQSSETEEKPENQQPLTYPQHQHWDEGNGWKSTLNNLRLLIQPLLLFWLILPWFELFPNHNFCLGWQQLINCIYHIRPYVPAVSIGF